MSEAPDKCPHCGDKLKKWATPEMTNWESEYHLVCFNDECPYFIRGWQWMRQKYEANASYRFRYDPANKSTGPLPVWSKDALKNGIIEENNSDERDSAS